MKTALFLIFAAQAGNAAVPVEKSIPLASAKQVQAGGLSQFLKASNAPYNPKAANDPRGTKRTWLKLRKRHAEAEAKERALQAAWDARKQC